MRGVLPSLLAVACAACGVSHQQVERTTPAVDEVAEVVQTEPRCFAAIEGELLVETATQCVVATDRCEVGATSARTLESLGAARVETGWILPELALAAACSEVALPADWERVTLRENVYIGEPLNSLSENESLREIGVHNLLVPRGYAHAETALAEVSRFALVPHRTLLTEHDVDALDVVRWRGQSQDRQGLVARVLLGASDPWAMGLAAYLLVVSENENWSPMTKVMRWIPLFEAHRAAIDGARLSESALAGATLGLCFEARLAEAREGDSELPLHQPLRDVRTRWLPELDQRHAINPRDCLRFYDTELAAIRYPSAPAETLLSATLSPEPEFALATDGENFLARPQLSVETSRGQLVPGDAIIAVQGYRVATRADIAFALRDLGPGESFSVVVDSSGTRARRRLVLPRIRHEEAVRITAISSSD